MASPDTDELATVPLPAGTPEARQKEAVRAAERDAAGVPVARQQQAEPGRAGAVPREASGQERDATEQVPGRPGAGSEAAVPQERDVTEQVPARSAAQSEAAAVAEAATVEQERVAPERIEPVDAGPDAEADLPAAPAKDRGRWWRGFTGSLAAGLVVLAVGVLVVGVICLFTGAPGPGAASLVGHPLAAVLALVAQRVADRRRGLPAAGGGAAVVLFAVSAATIFWFS